MQTGPLELQATDCSPASGNFSSISHFVNPPPAASGSNSDRLVTLTTSLVEICCPARSAHVICPRQRVIDEVAERSPAGTNVPTNGLTLTWLLWERMLEEETQHFSRCVRPPRIRVGARWAASRPCMSSSVDIPVLKDSAPTRAGMDGAGIGMPSSYLPAMHLLLCARRSDRLLKNLIAVVWMHRTIAIAVKNNHRDR